MRAISENTIAATRIEVMFERLMFSPRIIKNITSLTKNTAVIKITINSIKNHTTMEKTTADWIIKMDTIDI